MKPILILQDADIFPKAVRINDFLQGDQREAVKILLFDVKNKVALVGTKYRLLPGGGVEKNETLESAVTRECLEETGCHIKIIKEFGYTDEYRAKRGRQITHFFVANVIREKGVRQTKQTDELGIKVEWMNFEEAISLLQKEVKEISFESYNSCFNVRTHLAFLKKYRTENLTPFT